MKLPPFLLDHWLAAPIFASPPIRFNLAASTGPVWTLKEVLALGAGAIRDELDNLLDGSNSRALCQSLASAGALIAPGDCFDDPAHFRVGIGAQGSGFQEALAIASQVIAVERR
jgi:hypothetical protein